MKDPKNFVAVLMVSVYCLAFLLDTVVPWINIAEIPGRQYERFMLMVIGFYFGSHREKNRASDKKTPSDTE